MKRTYWCFILILQLACWVSAAARTFAPNHALLPHKQQGLISGSLDSKEAGKGVNEEAFYRGMRKIGSSPPSCEHKCYGCIPCEAIQVPTATNRHSHVGVQYTNYEPEGWKCKCGPSFYSP
ncbi:EPIDERMAL PATTERNING FACTOR-like protein 3 isoform X1 [Benincasa hispida]|uniref:EPIDERMAL PATTERNING FACTOR-like protein 3 isoform X1 n=1 Tax=Benincasa hispida TaxID=102211 RepID=UPI0018FF4E62|nr:EPIDERMAL PATTERNING FACTOR-like protein 3 isoform X1 [Benincasa hispida]